jgi:chromosome segregation ATPase
MSNLQGVISSLKQQLGEQRPSSQIEELTRQVSVLTARYQEQQDMAQKLRLENEVLATRIASTEYDELTAKYKELLAVNFRLTADNERLEEILSVTRSELKLCRDEKQQILVRLKGLDEKSAHTDQSAAQRQVENAALLAKMTDLRTENARLSSELARSTQQSAKLSRENIEVRGRFAKFKDQTGGITCRLGAINDQAINLQRFGFMLADALCQRFNPQSTEDELRRLIHIAKEQHIVAAESQLRRPPIRYSGTIAGDFDHLEKEITTLESHWT